MNTLHKVPKPCPFCGEDPGLARQVHSRFIVGCESDDCYNAGICAQASGKTAEAAWAAWNKRAPQLTVVARNNDLELASSTKGIG